MIHIIKIIVIIPASSAITVIPPYSPADALFKKLKRNPCNAFIPTLWQDIPIPKLTVKYPSPIGKPSFSPSKNLSLFIKSPTSNENEKLRFLKI